MAIEPHHVQGAFAVIRRDGIYPNGPSTKWDVIDPQTLERFPPKAVLRIAKELAGDVSPSQGGGWPTNDPLQNLGFEIALKAGQEPSPEIASDIREILSSNVEETVKQRLVNARLGQGSFREALFEIWNGRCALTGIDLAAILRASHIKPWRISSDAERLDPRNGLLLAASIDALFDKFLITIAPNGEVLTAPLIGTEQLKLIGVPKKAPHSFLEQTERYLSWHRSEFDRLLRQD